jgi:hypothetical protein
MLKIKKYSNHSELINNYINIIGKVNKFNSMMGNDVLVGELDFFNNRLIIGDYGSVYAELNKPDERFKSLLRVTG